MIRSTSKNLLLSFAAIGLLSLVGAPAYAGEIVAPKAEEKAKSLIERNQRMITMFAHPTSKFRDMKYSSTEKLKDGFKVIYEVNYTAFRGRRWLLQDGGNCRSKLHGRAIHRNRRGTRRHSGGHQE
jgi:hypothetical protein